MLIFQIYNVCQCKNIEAHKDLETLMTHTDTSTHTHTHSPVQLKSPLPVLPSWHRPGPGSLDPQRRGRWTSGWGLGWAFTFAPLPSSAFRFSWGVGQGAGGQTKGKGKDALFNRAQAGSSAEARRPPATLILISSCCFSFYVSFYSFLVCLFSWILTPPIFINIEVYLPPPMPGGLCLFSLLFPVGFFFSQVVFNYEFLLPFFFFLPHHMAGGILVP